ncbi:hypothetical protein GpartN1_g4769.t1 [Galdieria partita]|uniref:BZIP domain-containing protein n=1 Tax=Galdieria partita TaxID=83374 RepID=A0A9C7UQF8_9RHOD|nr:hypothetical protein GpartN1_g3412.t1 [Galdieria partita]GJQ12978.1 hypothetical protein GpartN1_g4769.t1 [Galdieria partita]
MMRHSDETFPLLLDLPNGQRRQLQVSVYDTIGDVKRKLSEEFHLIDTLQFHFGNMELQDDKTLYDYGIPEIYEQTESLLRMIELGGLNPQKKPEALERMCIVVESLKNGVKDPKELVHVVKKDSKITETHPRTSNTSLIEQSSCSKQAQTNTSQPSSPRSLSSVMKQDSNQSSAIRVHSEVSSSTMNKNTGIISPKLPLEKLDEPNTLVDNNDDLFARLTDYFPDLFTPKGLSSLRSGATPRAWTTPRSTGFHMEESSLVSSPVDWVTSSHDNHSLLGSHTIKDNAPNWIREFTSSWNVLSQDRNEKSPKRRSRQTEANSSVYDSFQNTGDEGDHLSVSNNSSSDREGLLEWKSGEYSGNQSTYSGSHSDNTNSNHNNNNNNTILDDEHLSLEKHETRTVKRRGRKRKHPEMTEEERKAYRAMQNRRSAERSRQRKKIQQEAYQKRMEELCTENDELRSTVQALQERLEYLENLLSVSIRRSG